MRDKLKSVLYIGNKLSVHGRTPSAMERIEIDFNEFCKVITVSNKKNRFYRLIDMVAAINKYSSDVDIIIIDVFSTKAFYFALISSVLAKIYNKKYITVLRGGGLEKRLLNHQIMSKFIFNNSVVNISPSMFLHKTFEEKCYNVKYIPNHINLDEYKFRQRHNCKPKILWVRSFHKIYNPTMAIEVLRIVLDEYPDAYLCMIGPEKDNSLSECKLLVNKYGIESSVSFPGLLDKNEWIKLADSYDIFINTTDYDNHPVSVIEAMALGMPIVTTDAGGLKYLHADNKNALIVNKNDYKGMAEKINKIIDNTDLGVLLSKNSRARAKDFSWDAIKENWIEVINNG